MIFKIIGVSISSFVTTVVLAGILVAWGLFFEWATDMVGSSAITIIIVGVLWAVIFMYGMARSLRKGTK